MVVVTEDKIIVTLDMMLHANMVSFEKFGVPVDPNDKSKGLRWKSLMQMTDEDFDKIEQYFLNKQKEKK